MKKIALFAFFVIVTTGVFSQSQRLVLIEGFSQASCGPCASANPAFNALLSANTTKATSIKYQVSWPGTDPMNAQNPSDVAARVAYYGVGGVPDSYMDGNVYAGSPSGITQTSINNQYAVPSPFSMNLTHWFNTVQDSIFINCEITASQNTSLTTGRLRVAMIEKHISFTTPPGSNGEKDFYNVMRKMYPNPNGTPLAASWTNGQKKTVSFKAKIPSYIYKKSEIAVVAWIQDDSDKNVKQAAFSGSAGAPSSQPPVADFSADVLNSCNGKIKFSDQSGLFPTQWLWDFGDGNTSTQQNPTHQYTNNGTYTVKLTATNANGSNQVIKTAYVTVALAGTAPTGVNDNICGSGIAHLSATAAGGGVLNWYNAAGTLVNTGNTYSPNVTGTTHFWVSEAIPNAVKTEGAANNSIGAGSTYTANATQGLYFDVIKPCNLISVDVVASTSGNRTIEVVDASGTILHSTTVNIPSGNSTVNLNFALPAGTGFLLRPATLACNLYRNTAGAAYPYNASGVVKITGNTASLPGYYYFFYNWKVQQDPCMSNMTMVSALDSCSTGIEDLNSFSLLDVFPNPNSGSFTLAFTTETSTNYTIRITNMLGHVVFEESLKNFSGEYFRKINALFYEKGVYFVSVSDSKNIITKKLLLH